MNNYIVLFVCTGNICRSPMAEGIMKDLILDEVETHHKTIPLEIHSAGTFAVVGNQATDYAIEVAAKNGINLTFHRSRQITREMVEAADLIVTMEKNHTNYIATHWSNIDYVYELKNFDFDGNIINDTNGIMDPIGMGYDIYENVFEELHKEIERISPLLFSRAFNKIRKPDK